MLEVIYRLFEMMALVVCLHSLSGEKIKPDIYNTGFISVELAFMQMIQDDIVSKQMYFVVYLIYFLYAYLKFRDSIQITILKCLLVTIIVVFLQMIIYIPISFINYLIPNESLIIATINIVMFLILFFTKNNEKYTKVIELCIRHDWVLKIAVGISALIMIYCMFTLKKNEVIRIDLFILIGILMAIFGVLLYRWQQASYEIERKERELKITNLYNGVFEEMIENIRRKQHDFNNQITTVYSLHLTADSLENLIAAQREYCDNLLYENRYSKVLNCTGNSALAGFIYTKFIKAEKYGIAVEYDIAYIENTTMSTYDLVEIIGVLIDNAVEALLDNDLQKKIIFELKDKDKLKVCVRNPVRNISNDDIAKFFKSGYTTKTSGSGLGLSIIKKYQQKNKIDIYVRIYEEDSSEWIEFKIVEKV